MTTPTKTFPVVRESWTESEAGWGCRPDGYTYHLSVADRDAFVLDHWKSQPMGQAPHEYTREDGANKVVDVTEEGYNLIKASKNGIRVWQHERKEITWDVAMVKQFQEWEQAQQRQRDQQVAASDPTGEKRAALAKLTAKERKLLGV